jgi:outer membrane immunogenic protein
MLKKIILGVASVSAMTLAMSAVAGGLDNDPQNQAKNSGFYVTGQAGYNWTDTNSPFKNTVADKDLAKISNTKNGFVGRIGAGYQFNQYFAVDGGFFYLNPLKYKVAALEDGKEVYSWTIIQKSYAFDVRAKAMYPINSQFFAYGFGGLAYVHTSLKATVKESGENPINTKLGSNGYIRPEAGAGLGYKITDNVAITGEYDHIFGNQGKSAVKVNKKVQPNGVPDTNAVLVGVQYTF